MIKSIFETIFKTILPCAENIFITAVSIFVVGAVCFVVGVTAGRADSPLHSGTVLHPDPVVPDPIVPMPVPDDLVMKVIADGQRSIKFVFGAQHPTIVCSMRKTNND